MKKKEEDKPNQSTRRKKRITLRNRQHEDIKDNVKSTWRRKKRMNQINLQEERRGSYVNFNSTNKASTPSVHNPAKDNKKKITSKRRQWPNSLMKKEEDHQPISTTKENDNEVKQIYNKVNFKQRRKKKMTQFNQLTEWVETPTSVSTDVNMRNKQNTLIT